MTNTVIKSEHTACFGTTTTVTELLSFETLFLLSNTNHSMMKRYPVYMNTS
jgi:hypothetical protein